MSQTLKKLLLLVTPSWASGITAVVVALIIVGTNYYKSRSDIGALQEGIQSFQTLFGPIYHNLTDTLARNVIASNAPLLLFWALVGAVVYALAVRLFMSFNEIAILEQTLLYTNLDRTSFVRDIVLSSALRLVALFCWFLFCASFFKNILPAATLGATRGNALSATLILAVTLHIHIVFVRLIMLRVRVFSEGIIE